MNRTWFPLYACSRIEAFILCEVSEPYYKVSYDKHALEDTLRQLPAQSNVLVRYLAVWSYDSKQPQIIIWYLHFRSNPLWIFRFLQPFLASWTTHTWLTAAKLVCPCNTLRTSNSFARIDTVDTVVVIDCQPHPSRTCKTSLFYAPLAVRVQAGCSAFPFYTPS